MSAIDPSVREDAMAMIERWERGIGRPHHTLPALQQITLSHDVKDHMAEDIVRLVNDRVRRETYTAS